MTLRSGMNLFLDHPVFGAGLGAFVSEYFRESGKVQVIHSTPLWLLAEFGIFGAVVMMLPMVLIFVREVSHRREMDDAGFALVLAIVAFGVMSSVHNLMYQRVFWLVLGAGMAMATQATRRHHTRDSSGPVVAEA